MLSHEVERLTSLQEKSPHEYTWVPILWACKLIQRARTEGKIIIEPPVYTNLISSLDYIEGQNRKILNYGWINFPLAYTQVASISVFLYFLAALFGRQYLVPQMGHLDNTTFSASDIRTAINTSPFKDHTPDFYFPFFTIIEFISYMGWIKVAETLLNPFGDDDEDFEINYIIDRNLQTCYLIVDEAEEELEMTSYNNIKNNTYYNFLTCTGCSDQNKQPKKSRPHARSAYKHCPSTSARGAKCHVT